MAFGLPEYEDALTWFMSEAVHELVGAHNPLLAGLEWEQTPGTTSSIIQDQEGNDVELVQDPVPAEVVFRRAAIRRAELVQLWLVIDDMARQMAAGIAKGVFGTLDTVTAATGNVVDASGKSTFVAILEMLEQLEWSLTDDDKLSMPTLFVSPDTADSIPEPSASELAQLEELQERKLRELLARRRRRRLS